MPDTGLACAYRSNNLCPNERNLGRLAGFVDQYVEYNGQPVGVDGYRAMLEGNYGDIPDLKFSIRVVVEGASSIARLLGGSLALMFRADAPRSVRT